MFYLKEFYELIYHVAWNIKDIVKSPIIHLKMLFPKPPKSDLAGGLVYITKKHLERCISINGAAGKNRTCDPVITNDVLYH